MALTLAWFGTHGTHMALTLAWIGTHGTYMALILALIWHSYWHAWHSDGTRCTHMALKWCSLANIAIIWHIFHAVKLMAYMAYIGTCNEQYTRMATKKHSYGTNGSHLLSFTSGSFGSTTRGRSEGRVGLHSITRARYAICSVFQPTTLVRKGLSS